MNKPKNVLLVTNSTTEAEINLINTAIAAQQTIPIQLNLVHVIPSLPTCYFNIPSTVLLAEQYYHEAEQCLASVGDALGVSKENQWFMTGKIRTEVIRLASKLNTDFILASSSQISELHKPPLFKKGQPTAAIHSINHLVRF